MKITAPDAIICAIVEALETNGIGIGIASRCNISKKDPNSIEIAPKDAVISSNFSWVTRE